MKLLIPKLSDLDSYYPTLCGNDHIEYVSQIKHLNSRHQPRRDAAGKSRVTRFGITRPSRVFAPMSALPRKRPSAIPGQTDALCQKPTLHAHFEMQEAAN